MHIAPLSVLAPYWRHLRASYWFIPAIMVVMALALAYAMGRLDAAVGATWSTNSHFLIASRPEGARAVLAAIAGSMITVAGVTFSMTIVSVSFASAQFGPRLIGNFPLPILPESPEPFDVDVDWMPGSGPLMALHGFRRHQARDSTQTGSQHDGVNPRERHFSRRAISGPSSVSGRSASNTHFQRPESLDPGMSPISNGRHAAE